MGLFTLKKKILKKEKTQLVLFLFPAFFNLVFQVTFSSDSPALHCVPWLQKMSPIEICPLLHQSLSSLFKNTKQYDTLNWDLSALWERCRMQLEEDGARNVREALDFFWCLLVKVAITTNSGENIRVCGSEYVLHHGFNSQNEDLVFLVIYAAKCFF